MHTYYIEGFPISDELYHHGIKGQRWGVRRYQNPDGTLTVAGKARYGSLENFKNSQDYKAAKKKYNKTKSKSDYKKLSKARTAYEESEMTESVKRGNRMRRMGVGTTNVVAAGVSRQIAIASGRQLAAILIAGGINSAILRNHVDTTDPETVQTIRNGASAIGAVLSGAAAAATVANVVKTARDYNDIENSKNYKKRS